MSAGAPLIGKQRADFVDTDQVSELTVRGLGYLEAGFGINLEGPSGCGKTTLALHLATQIGRPLVLISGDDEHGSRDLLGRQQGFKRRKVVDNFIHSVLKIDEESSDSWVDERLTVAVRHGYTLVYDEFTRSKAEANNILLSVLEEGVLIFPSGGPQGGYLKVHPNFRAIFTSNPEDYAGVHRAQEALRDRLISMRLEGFDLHTETGIVAAKSGLEPALAGSIVTLVRSIRSIARFRVSHSVRAAVQIAKVVFTRNLRISSDDAEFLQVVTDVVLGHVQDDNERQRLIPLASEVLTRHLREGSDIHARKKDRSSREPTSQISHPVV